MTAREGESAMIAGLASQDHARAILNILEDFSGEKDRLADAQKAMLNILEDFSQEKSRLEATQKAMLNILEDFDTEKHKVERANAELVRENHQRRATAQALTERSSELARSNADLEQFAYVASHDLQEPLRMVSSYVQLLERRYKGALDAQAEKYIAYAVDGARRMQALIGGLLEYSRVGLHDSLLEAVSTDTALDRALADLRAALDESGAVVTRSPLPTVLAEGAQLAQVFQNLVANAIKFHKPNEPPRISVDASCENGEVTLRVRDEGIGLDQQYADRIFMIFQRLHTRTEYAGTGIGLAVCKKVVERAGGRIWVESEEGRGATFRFTLRAAERREP